MPESYSFRQFLTERGETFDDNDVVGTYADERVFRELKAGLAAMFVIAALLVAVFWDEGGSAAQERKKATARLNPADDAGMLELALEPAGTGSRSLSANAQPVEQPPIPTAGRDEQEHNRRENARDDSGPLAVHVVQPGDTLTGIAKKYYGRSGKSYWTAIGTANKDKLTDYGMLKLGMKLIIPRLPDNEHVIQGQSTN